MRTIYIFSYTMSLFIAVTMSIALFTNPHVYEMTTTAKAILIIVSAYCFLAFIYLPQLYKRGLMPINYHELSKERKIKAQFIANTLFLPFWLSLIIGALVSIGINWKTLLFFSVFVYTYGRSAYVTIKYK